MCLGAPKLPQLGGEAQDPLGGHFITKVLAKIISPLILPTLPGGEEGRGQSSTGICWDSKFILVLTLFS